VYQYMRLSAFYLGFSAPSFQGPGVWKKCL
jgi:hypothetical protein